MRLSCGRCTDGVPASAAFHWDGRTCTGKIAPTGREAKDGLKELTGKEGSEAWIPNLSPRVRVSDVLSPVVLR